MIDQYDINFMRQAVGLAKKGYGRVNPNPLVGAVIVKNGKVIGQGYHEFFGGPHAEINALKNIKKANGCTLYVTLEPCNHFGKTPPCTDRIINEKFTRVVVGMPDPNPLVNGKGIRKLKKAGIKVETGILKNEVRKLNEVYIKYIISRIPFVALKTAMTLDGKTATNSGESKWISNETSRSFVHELRHGYSAIMVGVNTVIADDPELSDRSGLSPVKNPIKIIVDSNGRTPAHAKVLKSGDAKIIVAVTKNAPPGFLKMVNDAGGEVLICPEKNKRTDLTFLVRKLGERGIDSILLEGGSALNFSAIEEGIVDKVYSFISPKMIGGEKSKSPLGGTGFNKMSQAIRLNFENVTRMDDDLMIESYFVKS
jgi:diaminohydroxyphosphoribosylaminopyrimidine deaminase/5-amino-6-(5-phosphoribosylamino)uracil reductase